jgi:hypothetical protein
MAIQFERERHHGIPSQARNRRDLAVPRHHKRARAGVNVMKTRQRRTAEVAKELDATRRGRLAGLHDPSASSPPPKTRLPPHMNTTSASDSPPTSDSESESEPSLASQRRYIVAIRTYLEILRLSCLLKCLNSRALTTMLA